MADSHKGPIPRGARAQQFKLVKWTEDVPASDG